jgi:thiamine-phosphate diphosphorylase
VPPDYRLIAITGPELPGHNVLDSCRAAAAGGATAIQIRWKHAGAAELLRATERLLGAVDVPVYVNDRLDVALAIGAHGVHLGADDLPLGGIRSIVPPTFRVGLSVGCHEEATGAAKTDAHYWSLGPFWHTHSKADAGTPLGPDGFRRLANLAPEGVPVIAIGGIDGENVSAVIDAGGQGVAVISAIFGAADIEAATRRIRDALDTAIR